MDKKQYPTSEEFLIDIPLYEVIKYEDDSLDKGQDLVNYNETLDTYCPKCNNHSIFSRENISYCNYSDGWINYGRFGIELICSRDKEHKLFFLFYAKIKQYKKLDNFHH